jgi:hypothetical protein
MLFRPVKLFLQGFSVEHYIAVPLKQIGLLARSLNNILQRATQSISTHYYATQGYSGYLHRTLIHCSAWRIDCMLRATTAGSTRLSSNRSRPPQLVDVTSEIGAERIGVASSISGSRTTTLVLVPCDTPGF